MNTFNICIDYLLNTLGFVQVLKSIYFHMPESDLCSSLSQTDNGESYCANRAHHERLEPDKSNSSSSLVHAWQVQESNTSSHNKANQPLHTDSILRRNDIAEFSSKHNYLSKRYTLPKLHTSVLENAEMMLSSDGKLVPVSNNWLRLDESLSPSIDSGTTMKLRPVLKCKASDPLPLMPSATLMKNHAARCYDEPIRDRDKDWCMQSQRQALGVDIDLSVGTRMKQFNSRTEAGTKISFVECS
mmetsp:Transcript_22525/g.33071  ORF Transcript_22525/g.33071 Transcript_22525/m.33071 type:complete len:243 (+) Transcript_22525:3-731(+)